LPSPPGSAPGLVLLLLDLRLTTCPSPHGLDLELQYSMVLLGVILMFKWCCARICDVLGVISLLVEWELLLLVMLI
jgi:hypothetical protein